MSDKNKEPAASYNASFLTGKTQRMPKYEQLKLLLLDYINTTLPENQLYLPYEKDLAEIFHVSRSTVTHALELLREEGYIATNKRSGSRILNRKIDHPEQKTNKESRCDNIAFLFANTIPNPVRNQDFCWELCDEVEHAFAEHGVQSFIYNLRENDWHTWSNPENLAESMKKRKIRFVIIMPNYDEKLHFRKLLETLNAYQFKVALPVQSATEFSELEPYLLPGMDYLLLNTLFAMQKVLNEDFQDASQFFYIANEIAMPWAAPRIELCRVFCNQKKIPFYLLQSKYLYLSDEMRVIHALDVDEKCIEKFQRTVHKQGKIACFCSNDYTAFSFISQLKKQGEDPSKYHIIGFDNNIEFHYLHFSSFTRDAKQQAQALLQLYQNFMRTPNETISYGTGITTYARFIKRHL